MIQKCKKVYQGNKLEGKIIQWFKMVCEGIRQEYEYGASRRKLEADIAILKKLFREI